MFLGTLVFVGLSYLGAFFYSGPSGLFGVSHTISENLAGLFLLLGGSVLFVLSFLLFRRNNTWPVISLIIIVSTSVILFSLFEGLSNDIIAVYIPYVFGMITLYFVDKKLYTSSLYVTKAESSKKSVTTDKKLIIIPIVLLAGILLYFTVISGWIGHAKKVAYHQKVISEFMYRVYTPTYIPAPYKFTDSELGPGEDYTYYKFTGTDNQWFTLAQYAKPATLVLSPPHCIISNDSNTNFELFYGGSNANYLNSTCRRVTTIKGTEIFIMQNPLVSIPRNYAVALVGSTLIAVDGYTFSDQELGNLIDSCR